jgi:hypothetical protein
LGTTDSDFLYLNVSSNNITLAQTFTPAMGGTFEFALYVTENTIIAYSGSAIIMVAATPTQLVY